MKNFLLSHKKWIVLGIIIGVGILSYLVKITNSALWYDESIEYFYSKVMNGEVPGGLGSKNMYERICRTFQPPLYNVLMYAWLTVFDGEFAFRLAGVLVTLIGAIGVYFSVNIITNYKWAAISTLLYIFTPTVAYYALECGEYNLMLCCTVWCIFFYIKFMQLKQYRDLTWFFVCACMAVCSQYGAVFVVVGIFVVLVLHFIKEHNYLILKRITLLSIIITIVVVLPLIIFFLVPQLKHQGISSVTHMPVFAEQNVLIDFFKSIFVQISWNFKAYGSPGILGNIPLVIIGIAFVATIIVGLKRDKLLNSLLSISFISWIVYYFAVLCSFYAYNDWNSSSVGTQNIGNRYGLLFVPIWIITCSYGIYLFYHFYIIKTKGLFVNMCAKVVLLTMVLLYCLVEVKVLYINWNKDDIREVALAWYNTEGYNEKTLIHQMSDANFQFYLQHDDRYQEEYQENILAAGLWIRTADYNEMDENLKQLGIYNNAELYYIGTPMYGLYGLEVFPEVMQDNGYKITVLYEGKSALLHLKRK